jgi:hypothetical protein
MPAHTSRSRCAPSESPLAMAPETSPRACRPSGGPYYVIRCPSSRGVAAAGLPRMRTRSSGSGSAPNPLMRYQVRRQSAAVPRTSRAGTKMVPPRPPPKLYSSFLRLWSKRKGEQETHENLLIESESGDHTGSTSADQPRKKTGGSGACSAPRSRRMPVVTPLWHHVGTSDEECDLHAARDPRLVRVIETTEEPKE